MTNDAQRIFRLEGLVRTLQQQVLALQIGLAQTAQNQATAPLSSGGSGSSGGGAFVAVSSTPIIPGATDAPIAGVPGVQNEFVYKLVDGDYVELGSFPCLNPFPDFIEPGRVMNVDDCGDGTFLITNVAPRTFV